ncbi:MAG: CopG family transcriptional regulator [Actinobacteria bacterium]|nr:CopG family transcriptional regulator [Actinomycetota bacterium]
MRTTLTLDPDVATQLDRRRRERHSSLKTEVNHLLRVGLEHERESARTATPERFRVEPLDVGELLIDVDDVTAALDLIDPPRL